MKPTPYHQHVLVLVNKHIQEEDDEDDVTARLKTVGDAIEGTPCCSRVVDKPL